MPDPTEQLAVIRAEYWDWYEDDDEDRYEDTKSFELVRNRLPHVLAAVESVLALHTERPLTPFSSAAMVGAASECRACSREWPCPTVRAIESALEGGDDAE